MNARGFFTKKKIIWTIIILLIVGFVGYRISQRGKGVSGIQTDTAKVRNLKSTVLATGQVVSGTDLQLSFKSGGIVERVLVKEGSKVKQGDVLASLDQRDQQASLTSARGSLAQAQAGYQRVIAGASSEEVAVSQRAVDAAQVALESAKKSLENTRQQQETAVQNAYSSLLNSGLAAVASPGNTGSGSLAVTGTYTGTDQGMYKISIYSSGSGQRFQISGLESMDGEVKSVPVPLGTRGLFVQSVGQLNANDSWTVTIPNTMSATYVTAYNAYQAALKARQSAVDAAQSQINSAQTSLDQARAALDLKRAQARPADIEAAQAQILTAQGQVQAAQAALENTVIRAPADGTITGVDIKPGELATAMKEVFVLQDIGNLHAEANVSEANIASLQSGQSVDLTFDALGPDRHFTGTVQTVNPASTVVSGVVNYKVTASLDNIPDIKPGMTANMTVLVAQKDNVLAIPLRAVINRDNKKYVRVITDPKKNTYEERQVTTGLEADEGLVEVTSGLKAGDVVVTFIKQ